MDTNKPSVKPNPNDRRAGIYVHGVAISSTATAFKRKDGSGIVAKVTHEIATQPGVVSWERYYSPATDLEVKVDGLTVTEFPKLEPFAPITLRAERFKADGEKLIILQAIVVP